MASELPKTYDAAAVQTEVAAVWEAEKSFHAEPTDPGEPYSIVIPPPNVTAALHLGHALNNTIQDILTRKARMEGKNAVWLPGTDHAGIATQTVVEKRVMKEEGLSRVDFAKRGDAGRNEFVQKIQAWKDEYEQVILGQLKAMGCSCDWDRTAFTMDEPRAKAVREAFFQLFKAGLIYRGKRLVNWDPATQTALADDEVENEEVDGFFYYLKYPLCDENGNLAKAHGASTVGVDAMTVTVATTRPETMLGDTAVAINPSDPRAAALKGKFVRLPIVNRVIPIIEDDYVVKPVQFGGDPADTKAQVATGFLKVTPAHDPNDYDIGQRHKLPVINVMAPDGSISDKHGWSQIEPAGIGDADFLLGKSRETAREEVVEWFRRHDLLEDVKPYRHSVGHSYRSHVPIEPYLSDQWYCRVTDDRLRGAALRAMSPEQRSATSRDREGAPSDATTQEPLSYLITFTTYGTWLHGSEKGSVHTNQNALETPIIEGDSAKEQSEFERLKHEPFDLGTPERTAVQDAIVEVSSYRGWQLQALHIRTNHVHAVVTADQSPERVMNDFKAYATRRLKKKSLIGDETRVWTRHGSTRYLNQSKSVEAAIEYVVDEQGASLSPLPVDKRRPALPDGRGSLPSSLTFYPARYAKTYQTWHENIRDWCISRQLWWGHRIPVWRSLMSGTPDAVEAQLNVWKAKDLIVYKLKGIADEQSEWSEPNARGNLVERFVVVRADQKHIEDWLSENGFDQDPDVLDTWFSSGLWPLSTLGWPENFSQRAATVRERPDATKLSSGDDFAGRSLTVAARDERTPALAKWNPTSVLTTAREIITLWVSRMVMFNEFFLGQVPFKDVFIHAMIQDGDGRKMSKSLGNGVDPLDIISSHGTDALRFTLTSMCTQTQDVRMPVEKDPTTGKNTSPKFDIGRNFANKVWNAARFVIGQIQSVECDSSHQSENADGAVNRTLQDEWILSRLNRTIDEVDAAVKDYRFDQYAKACYDFFWGDFCDWYVEVAKPQMKDPTRAAGTARVLASVLDASLRLMHPIIPFVTEKIWWNLNEVYPDRGIAGQIDCPAAPRIIKAQWPHHGAFSESAEQVFGNIKEIVVAIRNLRSDYKVDVKKSVNVSIRCSDEVARQIESLRASIETLAACSLTAVGAAVTEPANVAKAQAGGSEVFVEGLVDPEAEKLRKTKRCEELTKLIVSMKGRLSNQGYLAKAPPHLVKQTQDQLAEAESEAQQLGCGA